MNYWFALLSSISSECACLTSIRDSPCAFSPHADDEEAEVAAAYSQYIESSRTAALLTGHARPQSKAAADFYSEYLRSAT